MLAGSHLISWQPRVPHEPRVDLWTGGSGLRK